MKMIRTVLTVILTLTLLNGLLPSRTPQYPDREGVSEIIAVEIGGIQQGLLIRGKDVENPILLFLHGGPGYANIAFARKYQSLLEEEFIVVNWDQRGVGKSYARHLPAQSMTRDQFILDTVEVIQYLTERFGHDRVFLAGHSWGSDLGLHLAHQYPELISAYIGIGQVIHSQRQHQLS